MASEHLVSRICEQADESHKELSQSLTLGPQRDCQDGNFLACCLDKTGPQSLFEQFQQSLEVTYISVENCGVTSICAGRWFPLLHWPMQVGNMLAISSKNKTKS